MAIDTSIYGQIQQPQIESPLNALAKISQVQGIQNQNKLAQLTLANAEREQGADNALAQLLAKGGTPEAVASGLAQQGYGKQSLAYTKQAAEMQKQQREAEKANLESAIQKQGIIAQYAGSAKDQASWTAAKQALAGMGIDVSQVPDQFDPATAQTLLQRSLTGVQQLEQMWKQKNFDLDTAKFGYQQQNDAANRGVTIRGQNMVDARAREANQAGKAPAGYRYTPDGNLEAIPGGPADIKAGELGAKRAKSQQAAIAQADRVIGKVDQALKKVGWDTAGGPGKFLSGIPGTEAKNLETDLETIKANLGFAELQAMRDASPTGGALGAIAVQELTALQSTIASLDQAQSPSQLRARLGEIRNHYSNWKKAVSDANGGEGTSSGNQGSSVIDFGSLK